MKKDCTHRFGALLVLMAVVGFSIVASAQTKRVLEEEYTGTECGWCPRGIVGMELAKRQFGDRLVLIAVHSKKQENSPMSQLALDAGYGEMLENVSGYPKCGIDRSVYVDPYFGGGTSGFGLAAVIENQLKVKCEADISLVSRWTSSAKNKVKGTANFKFFSRKNVTYALAYVLTADSLKGDGKEWFQANKYAGTSEKDPNLVHLTKLPALITNMVYNHVAIAGCGGKNGIAGSVEYPVKIGKDYVHSQEIDIPVIDGVAIDKSTLRMIVMLINTKNGEVVNVAQASVEGQEPGAVDNVTGDESATVVARYGVNGQEVTADAKGVQILKYSDGHVEKRMVR